ncbi:CotH kinase family protein [Prochlorococcus marinus]|uniref:Right handed beta helix domain-containing protein n=1 Tax=Prochlorococcus marinus (strain MIT 9211) TaxID=93059 RepID=A9BA36_PROM4|nr:CotH kinase family protein [Prochlorococcus marinus]ABX08698.1 Hypothetical protein P9211_07671 [Prochlorococcus marinus str. MIT 9211]
MKVKYLSSKNILAKYSLYLKSKLNRNRKLLYFLSIPLLSPIFIFGTTNISTSCKELEFSPLACLKSIYTYRKAEVLELDIKFLDYKKLEFKRNNALEKGVLQTEEGDYVDAIIKYDDKDYNVRIRLKGDRVDHFDGKKWSFRVKVRDGKRLFGMKKFSLQTPNTRRYINEWTYHKLLKDEGVPSLRYKFVSLRLNGEDYGVYSIEEHFDKILIENNRFKEGPIISMSEAIFWENKLRYKDLESKYPLYKGEGASAYSAYDDSQYRSEPIAFQENYILKDQLLSNQFKKGSQLLEGFLKGYLTTSEAFDIETLAAYLALSDLANGHHGDHWINLRFYYNPISSKLLPVGFDSIPDNKSISKLLIERNQTLDFFMDPELVKKYIYYLDKVSSPDYLYDFLLKNNNEYQFNLKLLRYSFPFDRRVKDFTELLKLNSEIIRKKLNPTTPLNSYLQRIDEKEVVISIGNKQRLPLEILGIDYLGSNPYVLSNPYLIAGKEYESYVKYNQLTIPSIEKIPDFKNLDYNKLRVKYRLLGANQSNFIKLKPYNRFEDDKSLTDIMRRSSNIEDFNFLSIDNSAKRITIKPGSWVLSKPMIIPKGFTFAAKPGVNLILKDKATIISRSPILFLGNSTNPINISAESEGQGIFILEANQMSKVQFVNFTRLSSPQDEHWGLTGAITFYKSPVSIKSCLLSDFQAEDALNIVKSQFTIEDTQFINSKSDSLDVDFSNGIIENTYVLTSGNDGLDFSGSTVTLKSIFIDRAGDKAISIGEESNITGNNVLIKNSAIGFASKDKSIAKLESVDISNSDLGFAVFQKKPEYGPGSISISKASFIDVDKLFLLEPKSILVINGTNYEYNANNVESLLYGEQYGKKSQ